MRGATLTPTLQLGKRSLWTETRLPRSGWSQSWSREGFELRSSCFRRIPCRPADWLIDGLAAIIDTYFPGGSDSKASAYNDGNPGRSLVPEDPLEKEMATHSSTLVQRKSHDGERGRL